MYQHPSDWRNTTGAIRYARERAGMGVILLRPLTSGVFQRLMAESLAAGTAAIEIDVLDVGRLLLKTVLSDPYVDVALAGVRETRGAGTERAFASRGLWSLTAKPWTTSRRALV